MTTTFENSKVGETVFSPIYSWGKIEQIDANSKYPIIVSFFNNVDKNTRSFTFTGYSEDLQEQSLFWCEVISDVKKEPTPMKSINGVKVPDISFIPSYGDFCYLPVPIIPKLYIGTQCDNPDDISHLVENCLCYPFTEEGKSAAILHAKALLGVKQCSSN